MHGRIRLLRFRLQALCKVRLLPITPFPCKCHAFLWPPPSQLENDAIFNYGVGNAHAKTHRDMAYKSSYSDIVYAKQEKV